MADKDEFMFDEEDDTGFDSAEEPAESEDWDDYEPEKKGGSKRTLYLLLLLLVLLGGAAYVLFLAPDDGPSSPVKVVKVARKPIAKKMPKPPTSKPATAPVKAAADKPAAAQPVSVAKSPAVEPAPKPVAPVVAKPAPESKAKTDVAPQSKPEAKVADVVTPKSEPAQVKPKLFESKSPAPSAVSGDYTLSAGAFVLQSSVDGVLKKIRKLGYKANIQNIKREITMTRLLVGVYPAEIAAKELRRVKRVTSGAFSLNKGGKTAIYAGSYLVLDKARVFADTVLSRKGIRVTEETVKIERNLQRVTFGSFASRADAVKASQEAAGQGLDAKPATK
jgi:outer membrane biosynthesis protein TonB